MHLLSLSTQTANALIRTTLHLPPDEGRRERHPEWTERRAIDVYSHWLKVAEPGKKEKYPRPFILTLADVPFSELLPRWMEVKDRFAPTRAMILGLRYAEGGYLEPRVITAVGAAESMHRALDPAPPIPDDEFKVIRSLLLDTVPVERKQWLHGLLIRNEPSLKMRLADLIERLGEVGTSVVPDPKKWIKAAVNARDTLAHVGRTSDYTLHELHAVVEVTAAVVVLNLLHELGVPEERMLTAVTDKGTLSQAARLGREYFAVDEAEPQAPEETPDSAPASELR